MFLTSYMCERVGEVENYAKDSGRAGCESEGICSAEARSGYFWDANEREWSNQNMRAIGLNCSALLDERIKTCQSVLICWCA